MISEARVDAVAKAIYETHFGKVGWEDTSKDVRAWVRAQAQAAIAAYDPPKPDFDDALPF